MHSHRLGLPLVLLAVLLTALLVPCLPANAQGGGEDRLRATDQAERWPDSRTPLPLGEATTGKLSSRDGLLFDETYFDIYTFDGEPGDLVTIQLASDDFDPVLMLIDPDGFVLEINDDENFARGDSSQIEFFPSLRGTYQAWANSVEVSTGMYTISVKSQSVREGHSQLQVGHTVDAWLAPGDTINAADSYEDVWRLEMPPHPVAVLATSRELDLLLWVNSPSGELVYWADDISLSSGDLRPLVYLEPSKTTPEGSEVVIEVSSTSELRGGQYQLTAAPFPGPERDGATLQLRLLRVHGENGKGGSQATTDQVLRVVERSRDVWKQCGIGILLDSDEPRPPVEVPGVEDALEIADEGWTDEELALQELPERVGPTEGILTVFVVPRIEGGGPYSTHFSSTTFAPSRVSIILSDAALHERELELELARQIGEMLGLPDPTEGDGDPNNDTTQNLMAEDADTSSLGGQLSPMQCALARRAPHFIQGGDDEMFTRFDAILSDDRPTHAYLLPGDETLDDGEYLDVYYFHGRKGETIRLEATSEDFDTYLMLDRFEGDRIAEDDDGGTGTNAYIEATLPENGDYGVAMTSALPGEVGAYQLRLIRESAR